MNTAANASTLRRLRRELAAAATLAERVAVARRIVTLELVMHSS